MKKVVAAALLIASCPLARAQATEPPPTETSPPSERFAASAKWAAWAPLGNNEFGTVIADLDNEALYRVCRDRKDDPGGPATVIVNGTPLQAAGSEREPKRTGTHDDSVDATGAEVIDPEKIGTFVLDQEACVLVFAKTIALRHQINSPNQAKAASGYYNRLVTNQDELNWDFLAFWSNKLAQPETPTVHKSILFARLSGVFRVCADNYSTVPEGSILRFQIMVDGASIPWDTRTGAWYRGDSGCVDIEATNSITIVPNVVAGGITEFSINGRLSVLRGTLSVAP